MKTINNLFYYLCIAFIVVFFSACEKTLETRPGNIILATNQFASDQKAGEAVVGLYATIYGESFTRTTFNQDIALYAGLSADEFFYNGSGNTENAFYNNTLNRTNGAVAGIWQESYNDIFQTNSVIENVTASAGISQAGKNQFIGEAKFLRAFCYFYMVNMYGDVPLITNVDFKNTSTVARTPVVKVYQQIIADLIDARNLLKETYPTAGRVRANKAAATALLARVYLYNQDWANAEKSAAELITNSHYALVPDFKNLNQSTSSEAIFQFWSPYTYTYYQGTLANYPAQFSSINYGLTSSFLNSFEAGDKRKTAFTDTVTFNGNFINYPVKYRNLQTNGAEGTEYYTALRLGEQYLIRAEARAHLNKVSDALSDLNVIRTRAGLPELAIGISQSDALLAIEKERRIELCYEWGHRWFDLKRTGRINTVLIASKPAWKPTMALFPIPQGEIQNNTNLTQNPGY